MQPMPTIQELRERVQAPVAHRNDWTGRFYGSRISIRVTWLFLRLGWSANAASFLMLFCGLTGSALLAIPGWWAVAGFFVLNWYYLFDCTDGEIARFHGCSHMLAAYYDYLAHALVKPAMFLGLGIGLARDPGVGHVWPLLVAIAPAVVVLLSKIISDLHHVVFCQKFILFPDREAIRSLEAGRPAPPEAPAAVPAADSAAGPARRPLSLGVVRELVLNFDFALLLFLGAALLDVLVPLPAAVPSWLGFKMVLFLGYAVVLPLNFLDHAQTDLRSRRFLSQLEGLQRNCARMFDKDGRRVLSGRDEVR